MLRTAVATSDDGKLSLKQNWPQLIAAVRESSAQPIVRTGPGTKPEEIMARAELISFMLGQFCLLQTRIFP